MTTSPSRPIRRVIRCLWPGCERPVPRGVWGCARHYYTLPDEIRERIQWAYALECVDKIDLVHKEAQDWIAGIHERAKDATDPGVPRC